MTLGQERAPASEQLDAGDSALHELELAYAVVNVGLIFHDVCIGIVGEQLSAKGLSRFGKSLQTIQSSFHFLSFASY